MENYGLQFSEPKEVSTKFGLKVLRKAEPTHDFWAAWKTEKTTLKNHGYSVGKSYNTDQWEVCHWGNISENRKEEIEEKLEESRAVDADIDIPCPDGISYMPFQKAGIAYAANRNNVIYGDEMGLGKTIQVLGAINYDASIKTVLVVCPNSLKLNWRKEAEKWLVRDFKIGVVNRSEYPEDADFVIVNYEVVVKHYDKIASREWDLVVCDEMHRLKNPKAAITQAVYGTKNVGN